MYKLDIRPVAHNVHRSFWQEFQLLHETGCGRGVGSDGHRDRRMLVLAEYGMYMWPPKQSLRLTANFVFTTLNRSVQLLAHLNAVLSRTCRLITFLSSFFWNITVTTLCFKFIFIKKRVNERVQDNTVLKTEEFQKSTFFGCYNYFWDFQYLVQFLPLFFLFMAQCSGLSRFLC